MVSKLWDFCESCDAIPDAFRTQTFLPKLERPRVWTDCVHHTAIETDGWKSLTSHSKTLNFQLQSSFRQSGGVY